MMRRTLWSLAEYLTRPQTVTGYWLTVGGCGLYLLAQNIEPVLHFPRQE